MFSSEMTLASAWIHLLVIDLFAARYVTIFRFWFSIKSLKHVSYNTCFVCFYADKFLMMAWRIRSRRGTRFHFAFSSVRLESFLMW